MEKYKLFDAEYKFVQIIWENEPINSTELSKVSFKELGWKKPTTYNMIRKLCEKKISQKEAKELKRIIEEATK